MVGESSGDSTVRCEGGYKQVSNPLVGIGRPYRASCPTCGRVITFHWSTGKFKAHNAPKNGSSTVTDDG